MDEMAVRKLYPVSKINSSDTKIELNCRSIKAVLLYFEETYGREKLEEFICSTNMNLDYLEDRSNWISYEYWCRLLAKLVEYTRDPNAPFYAGAYAVRKECFGTLEIFFARLGTPNTAYKLIADFTPRYSKLGESQISDLRRNSCIITVRYFDKFKQDKNNCLNLQGIYASIPTFWHLPLAKVKHTKCAVGNACIYEISWRNKLSHFFGLWGLLVGSILFYIIKTFLWREVNPFLLSAIPVLGYFVGQIKDYNVAIRESIDINERESKDLMGSIETIEKLNIELQGKVEQRTKELDNSNKRLKKALQELKNSQNQLIQSEKMATVGRLAAGMAHELNNPVGAVRNYIQDVLEDIPEDDSRQERLKKAEEATGRCKRIVSGLLTFARESKELRLTNINDIVETTILNAREDISNPQIRILKELEPNLPKVKIDSMQFEQVSMNIIINASEAIEGKGEIVVKTSHTPKNIIVEISDTGKGVPKEIQDKIFDPFFTTKAPGKGIGLGLAISYSIIKRFDGEIRVKSGKDRGAIFTIILPLDDRRG